MLNKRILSFVCAVVLCACCFVTAFASAFDVEAATKSVLKLYGFYSEDSETYVTGSGFVAFNNRTLITNYHVIDGVTEMYASDDDDNTYELKYVLCADEKADIAILEFAESTYLLPLELYPDDQLRRGSKIFTIGSPKGLKNSVTDGVISYQYTNEEGVPEIQISAPISHGSSGGALFNEDGKVIGVTTWGLKEGQNLNFAVNISVAQAMYNAWDGTKYTFVNHKSTAKMDFTGVYNHPIANGLPVATEKPAENVAAALETWTCPNCGRINSDRFCLDCGTEKPSWICACGRLNSSKFCGSCGKKADDLVAAFNQAMVHADKNEYEEALSDLANLGEFNSGSYETVKGTHVEAKGCFAEVYYKQGMYLVSVSGDHDAIISCFNKAGNYGDAKEQIKAENDRYYGAFYASGVEKASKGDYAAAIAEFEKAGDYADAADKIISTYYLYGLSLLNNKEYEASRSAFGMAGEYSDAAAMILRSYYEEGMASLENGKIDEAEILFEQAGDYNDAKAQIAQIAENKKATIYDEAIAEYNKSEYEKAAKLFTSISGFKDADEYFKMCEIRKIRKKFDDYIAKDDKNTMNYIRLVSLLRKYEEIDEAKALIKELNYQIGEICLAGNNFRTAISYFETASDYADASEKLMAAKEGHVDSLLSRSKYEEAYDFINSELVPYGADHEYILLEPGDTSEMAGLILGMVRGTGFNQKIPQKEKEYKENYTDAVKKFEEYFGITADGNITLNEYMSVKDLIYSGVKNQKVKALVEKLADLSYLKNLQKDHTVYVSGYATGIKNAEKALGLNADGVITSSEYDVILNQKVEIEKPENVKVLVNNTTATITWSSVKNAMKYEVYDDNKLVGETNVCKLVLKNIETGVTKNYRVSAVKYSVRKDSDVVSVNVPIYYIPVSIIELNKNIDKYAGKYVEIKNARYDDVNALAPSGKTYTKSAKGTALTLAKTGKDWKIYILCKNSSSYVAFVIENYSGWDWWNNNRDIAYICHAGKVGSITGKGKVLEKRENCTFVKRNDNNSVGPITASEFENLMETPVIVLDEVKWVEK